MRDILMSAFKIESVKGLVPAFAAVAADLVDALLDKAGVPIGVTIGNN